MMAFCCGAVAGILVCVLLPAIWPVYWSALLVLPAILPRPAVGRSIGIAVTACCGFGAGSGSALLDIRAFTSARDALSVAGELEVTGVIADLPRCTDRYCSFDLAVGSRVAAPGRIRVTWSAPAAVPLAGMRCSFGLAMGPLWGYANPAGADAETRAWIERRLARGRVISGRCAASMRVEPNGLRESVGQSLHKAAGPMGRVFAPALVLGDRRAMTSWHWDLLAATGTAHLLAISGLHVALVAGLGGLAGRLLFRITSRLPGSVAERIAFVGSANRTDWAVFTGTAAAFAYASLAGMPVSARRALIMLAAPALALILRRDINPWRALMLALTAIVLMRPAEAVAAGTWLSFVAVAILLLLFVGRPRDHPMTGLWRLQLTLLAAMAPLLAALGLPMSGVAPLANMLAVPWVSAVVLPLSLAATVATVFQWPATLLWAALEYALSGLWWVLQLFADLPLPVWQHGFSPLVGLLGTMAVLQWVLPLGWPLRALALLTLIALAGQLGTRPEPGAAIVDVFDVGQGTAVAVHTARASWLVDTGPGDANWNAGRSLIAPSLQRQGQVPIDGLLVSHTDADHSGGLAGLQRSRVLAGPTLGSSPDRRWERCLAGQHWRRDGVDFRVLHPGAHLPYLGNDSSCVLLVSAGESAILLPGDVGARVEHRVLPNLPPLAALVAAHHGSATGTSKDLLHTTRPALVIATAGQGNRFGLPHGSVRQRVAASGATLLETAECGWLRLALDPSGTRVTRAARRDRQSPWHWPGLCPKLTGERFRSGISSADEGAKTQYHCRSSR